MDDAYSREQSIYLYVHLEEWYCPLSLGFCQAFGSAILQEQHSFCPADVRVIRLLQTDKGTHLRVTVMAAFEEPL